MPCLQRCGGNQSFINVPDGPAEHSSKGEFLGDLFSLAWPNVVL